MSLANIFEQVKLQRLLKLRCKHVVKFVYYREPREVTTPKSQIIARKVMMDAGCCNCNSQLGADSCFEHTCP